MPKVRFTKENLLERKALKPAWRRLKVKSVKEGPGKSDPDSTVYPIVFVIEEGDDAGVPINHWFTEKQMGRLAEFLACFMSGSPSTDKDYEIESVVGQSVLGYCENDIKTGFNVITEFRPVNKTAGA